MNAQHYDLWIKSHQTPPQGIDIAATAMASITQPKRSVLARVCESCLSSPARLCRKSPPSARERAVFSPGKDGEAGDIVFIVDGAGCSQAGKGPLEARATFPTEPGIWIKGCILASGAVTGLLRMIFFIYYALFV